ncbi:MAG: DUF885 family protein, partial [Gammaproteobacteria bacterium]|nr:DUF885 family protein [Gammaproteobacteria bacterium]
MACSPSDNGQAADGQAESGVAAVAPGKPMQATADEIAAEVERANQFFERTFMDGVMRSPTFQAYLGIKKDQDKWNDISDENAKRELEITRRELKELRETIDFNKLDEPTKLSYRLYVERAEQDIENFQYRLHNYPINQMYGAQSRLPSFLINIHRIDDETDARGYIARLNGIDEQITQVIENLKLRESKGIVAPKFVFPYAISDTKNVLSGKPFVSDALEDSA